MSRTSTQMHLSRQERGEMWKDRIATDQHNLWQVNALCEISISRHSRDDRHSTVMPVIGCVWQPCLESIRAPSCPSTSLPKCHTVWSAQVGKDLQFFLA